MGLIVSPGGGGGGGGYSATTISWHGPVDGKIPGNRLKLSLSSASNRKALWVRSALRFRRSELVGDRTPDVERLCSSSYHILESRSTVKSDIVQKCSLVFDCTN